METVPEGLGARGLLDDLATRHADELLDQLLGRGGGVLHARFHPHPPATDAGW